MEVNLEKMILLLKPLADKHGILFEEMKDEKYFPEGENIHPAPFSDHLGIRLPNTLLYREGAKSTRPVEPTGLIHEMGHIIFGVNADEYPWLAWEWTVARLLGVEEQWIEENHNYIVYEDGADIEFYEVKDYAALYQERMEAALSLGIPMPNID